MRFILSFRPSASRRAAAIFACICSPDISDIVESTILKKERFLRCEDTMMVIGGMGVEGTVGGLKGHRPVGSLPRGIATTRQVGKVETGRGFGLWLCL